MEIRLLYLVMSSPDEAKKIGKELVEANLAACVNILPKMHSIYRWKGKLVEDEETILLVKTQASRVDEIQKWVEKKHSYDCPCLLSFKVESGLEDYLKWVKTETD